MRERKVTYTPKYVNSSSFDDPLKDIRKDYLEPREGDTKDIIESLKEEVEVEIDQEHVKDEYFYVNKEKEYKEGIEKTRHPTPDKKEILRRQYRQKLRDYNSQSTDAPVITVPKIKIEHIALALAFIFAPLGLFLSIISIATAGNDADKRKKGIIGMIISGTIMFSIGSSIMRM